jgi:diguanylate cyclase (GGDEF)-like protein/PAS domain S-box-containing protein
MVVPQSLWRLLPQKEFTMPRNILLIQDDPADAQVIRDALARSNDGLFEVEWVRLCAAGVKRLATTSKRDKRSPPGIAAVLVDISIPDCKGIAAFDAIFVAAPQIPILVLCDESDEESAKLSVQHGAQDYLLKGRLDSYLLPKTLNNMLGNMLDRAANAEELFEEKERAEVTLNSIGDAVISTDVWCDVTYLNSVAEKLTGWSREEAAGRPIEEVFNIIDAATGAPAENPMARAIHENKTAGLTPNCLLVRRDGVEAAIEDSAAPIHDRRGQVTGAVMVFHDVTTARALSQRMAYLAQHDTLTDLPNRLMLNDRLIQAIALARRHQQKMAVLFLDIDRFKHVNDSLGHAIGDRLLQSVAARLVACVRGSDTVSRQGGDEFVILLSEVAHASDAGIAAEKILQSLRESHRIDEHEVHITASIGIVTYPDDGEDVDTLLRNADFAMYQVKGSAHDNYQFFKADMNARAVERQSLENDLRHALERSEFMLHYQPKFDLESNAIVGVEALIRWHHPQRGLITPEQFISIAEECGLIVPIGRWVLREACRQSRIWYDAGFPLVRMSVNISAVELRSKEFVENVRTIVKQTGIAPSCLELELTETYLMEDAADTAEVLDAIKGMGVQLALDDFGTGYSSLSYLKRFPIDTLKIDQSFVRNLANDLEDASIVSAVISMAKSLHMRVVAEGVETREQLTFLQQQRCPEGQGYYFCRPVNAVELGELLSHSHRQRR